MRFFRLVVVVAALVGAVAACGGGPTPVATAPTQAITATLVISGFDRYMLEPGVTIQLAATLNTSDGGKQDCTATALWSTSSDTLIKATAITPGRFLVVGAGDGSVRATCGPTSAEAPIHVDQPASWPLSGQVVSGADGGAIGGATFTVDDVPVAVDGAGRFSFRMAAASARAVISAPGFVTRETTLAGGQLRIGMTLDLIPNSMLLLVQEMVHARADSPNNYNHNGLIRWTEPPNFYIATNWVPSGQPINPAGLAMFLNQIPRMVGMWSGGRLTAGRIETGPEKRAPQAGWIVIHFQNIGNQGGYSPTQNMGFIQMGSDTPCGTVALLHELGHAMGVWHNTSRPSIMGGNTLGSCAPAELTPAEAAVAKMMYGRPRGNMNPDVDPAGSVLFKKGGR